MNAFMPDSNEPNLRVGVARDNPISGSQHRIGYFVGARVDVNRHDFAVVAGFDERPNPLFVKRRTKLSMLVLRVFRFPNRHDLSSGFANEVQ
jgi:hypothetical protein